MNYEKAMMWCYVIGMTFLCIAAVLGVSSCMNSCADKIPMHPLGG